MKAKLLGTLFLIGCLAASRADKTTVEWEKEAVRMFPELAVKDSKLRRLYDSQYLFNRDRNLKFFSAPNWPVILAQQCHDKLAEADKKEDAAVKKSAEAAAAAPQNKDVAFSLRPEYERLGIKVRDQGSRGTCVVFGITGCLDFYSAKAGGPTHLSEQFAGWAEGRVTGVMKPGNFHFNAADVIEGLKKFGICSEELMPYRNNNPTTVPSKAAIEDAEKRKAVTADWIHDWRKQGYGFSDAEMEAICKALTDEHPVGCATRWPTGGNWTKFRKTLTIDNRDFPMATPGHIVVLVGYEKGAKWEGGGRIQFRNSYGPNWGEGGYAWISFAFLKKHGEDAYVVKGAF